MPHASHRSFTVRAATFLAQDVRFGRDFRAAMLRLGTVFLGAWSIQILAVWLH